MFHVKVFGGGSEKNPKKTIMSNINKFFVHLYGNFKTINFFKICFKLSSNTIVWRGNVLIKT